VVALKVAELCAGYGGLTLAMQLLDQTAELAWYAEIDPDASTVMAHHHPAVPNHGDITTADWTNAGSVDVLTGGIPCQPWSLGGKRGGSLDERDLWPVHKFDDDGNPRRGMLDAVRALRPPLVVIENVPGLLTGDDGAAFMQILSDLDQLGYTTRWTTVGACRIGACHHRHRVFILATLVVGDLPCHIGMPIPAWSSWPRDGVCSDGMVWDLPSAACGAAGTTLPTPCASDGGSRGTGLGTYQEPGGRPLREVVAMLPTPTRCDGSGGPGHGGRCGAPNLWTMVTRFPVPGARLSDGCGDAVALLPTPRVSDAAKGGPNQRGLSGDLALPAAVQPGRWGRWAAVVARHGVLLGRPAPDPVIIGRRGGLRLNPRLTEWMLGLSDGHLIGVLADPNACNRLAGNGVMPQQAAYALRKLGFGRL